MVKRLCAPHAGGKVSLPDQGTEISWAAGCGQKKQALKKKKKEQVRNSVDKWDPSVFQLLLLQNSAVLMADN